MKQTVEYEDVEVEDVPVSSLLSVKRADDYGKVPDLDDEELADPCELERQAIAQQWGPILALPVRAKGRWVQPRPAESGDVDFNAFATVDFDRLQPDFDRAKYKADKLRERRADVLIMLGIVNERLPGRAKYLVLKYLRKGVIELEDIATEDMRALGQLYLRAMRLQAEITELQEASRGKRGRQARVWLEL